MIIDTFKRVEKKYLLNNEKYNIFLEEIKPYMQLDEFGLYTICNIYYDTDNYDLARISIDKPIYKEKLRLRSYGIPKENDIVFLEIKKKYDSVVYKRRIALTLQEAKNYLENKILPKKHSQILNEIDYFINFYNPKAKLYLAYDRQAYFDKRDNNLRITFDKNIRSREYDINLEHGDAGNYLLEIGTHLMEIKIPGAFPIWLSHLLAKLEIYPVSFSKYGNIYITNKFGGANICLQAF